jgi:hypothetical protein
MLDALDSAWLKISTRIPLGRRIPLLYALVHVAPQDGCSDASFSNPLPVSKPSGFDGIFSTHQGDTVCVKVAALKNIKSMFAT